MMSRLVVLPVGMGDAFLLEREEKTLLVDGGKDKDFVTLLDQHWTKGKKVIDVVVCTHNDQDHSDGIIQLLSSLTYKIHELRVPAIWDVIEAKLGSGASGDTKQAYVQELLLDVLYLTQQTIRSDYELKCLVNDVLRRRYRKSSNYCYWIEDLRQLAERGAAVFVDALVARVSDKSPLSDNQTVSLLDAKNQLWNPELKLNFFGSDKTKAQELALQILGCVNRILAIMTLVAYRRQHGEYLRIRYYRHRSARPIDPEEGEFLLPVNAAEVETWVFRKNAAGSKSAMNHPLGHLALTLTNRNSLAFYARETDKVSGVLFSGECCIDPRQCAPNRLIVATAPHHGADDNRMVYPRVNVWAPSGVVWVRSDWKCPCRPCFAYVQLRAVKYCTICNTATSQKQAVELEDIGLGWKSVGKVLRCTCH